MSAEELRVLIVEDRELIVEVIKEVYSNFINVISVAKNGIEALALMAELFTSILKMAGLTETENIVGLTKLTIAQSVLVLIQATPSTATTPVRLIKTDNSANTRNRNIAQNAVL